MSLSQSLWGDLVPPCVWITVGTIDCPEADSITLTMRVQVEGRRSVSATVPVTRYAPTPSILLAASKCLQSLEISQEPITRALLGEQLRAAVLTWVEPF
jgi:hypothetical protein